MIVVDVRGYLKDMDKDIALKGGATGVTYTAATKTANVTSSMNVATFAGQFDNVLSYKFINGNSVVLISTKGDETTVTITGAPVTAQ